MILARGYSAVRGLCLAQLPVRSRGMAGLTGHRPSKLEKFLLVYFKKYPMGQVPEFVPQDQMEKVQNMARVKFNILMCIATFFGACAAIWIGKRDRAKGVSLHQMNVDWHGKINTETKNQGENSGKVSGGS